MLMQNAHSVARTLRILSVVTPGSTEAGLSVPGDVAPSRDESTKRTGLRAKREAREGVRGHRAL